jgi:hypothetical protein
MSYLERFSEAGMSPTQIALAIDGIVDARAEEPEQAIDLILSGPELPGVPMSDTIATVRTLITEATQGLILVGYAVHNAKSVFELIASHMAANSKLRVMFCLDISRRPGDTSLESEILRRFTREFREKHWPWPNLPELYYDPRSLSENPFKRPVCMRNALSRIVRRRSSPRQISLRLLGWETSRLEYSSGMSRS